MTRSGVIRLFSVFMALLLYAFACILPCNTANMSWCDGVMILMFGWLPGCAQPVSYALTAWFSNVELFLSLICLSVKWFSVTIALSLLAIVGGCCAFLVTQALRDEGGSTVPVTLHGPGVFLWFASLTTPLVGAIVHLSSCTFRESPLLRRTG